MGRATLQLNPGKGNKMTLSPKCLFILLFVLNTMTLNANTINLKAIYHDLESTVQEFGGNLDYGKVDKIDIYEHKLFYLLECGDISYMLYPKVDNGKGRNVVMFSGKLNTDQFEIYNLFFHYNSDIDKPNPPKTIDFKESEYKGITGSFFTLGMTYEESKDKYTPILKERYKKRGYIAEKNDNAVNRILEGFLIKYGLMVNYNENSYSAFLLNGKIVHLSIHRKTGQTLGAQALFYRDPMPIKKIGELILDK